ncbi:glycosyltransferase family 4 protein [Sulfobacillus sp. hq2]|uniref:glycosyltransferase family 4 protein n=1 Tax=Sulfobacillus TaxID=28033 RepID=UPI000CD09AA5|nr:glycosyltransferase family 4 protein [Sulfobacillus sp. hq2]POB09122.1 hypothetical protein CO251_16265 [Sulfobacillus sp. hq2]
MKTLIISTIDLMGPAQGDRLRLDNLIQGAQALGSVDHWRLTPTYDVRHQMQAWWQTRSLYWARAYYAPRNPPTTAYDVVIAFQLRTAPFASLIGGRHRILDLTDSLGLFRHRLEQAHVGRLRQWILHGIEAAEVAWAKRFDDVWVSGWQDAQWLKEHGVTAQVVANAVREKILLPPGNPRDLLFVGNLAYLPNRTGLQRFLRTVWPHLARHQYRLHVVGCGSERIRGEGIIAYGYVPNLQEIYRQTGISLSPVELGTGTQNKILEAIGFGRPVICSPTGIMALPQTIQRGIHVATQPEDWLRHVEALQNPEVYQRTVGAAWYAVPQSGEPVTRRLRHWMESET